MPGRARAAGTADAKAAAASGTSKRKAEKAAKPLGLPPGKLMTNRAAREQGRAPMRIPQTKDRGNAKLDHEWVSKEMAAGRIKIIEDDADVPFEVKLQWDGSADTLGSEFYIPDAEYRCTGRAYVRDERGARIIDKDGNVLTRPCARWRMRGLNVCATHGGLTDGGRAAARRRGMEAIDMALGKLIRIIENDNELTADRLKAIFGLMDRFGMRGGEEITVNMPAWQQALREMFEEGTPAFEAGQELAEAAQAVAAPRKRKASPPRAKAD